MALVMEEVVEVEEVMVMEELMEVDTVAARVVVEEAGMGLLGHMVVVLEEAVEVVVAMVAMFPN